MIKRAVIAIIGLTLVGNIILALSGRNDGDVAKTVPLSHACSPTVRANTAQSTEHHFRRSAAGSGDKVIRFRLGAGLYKVHFRVEDSDSVPPPFPIEASIARPDGTSIAEITSPLLSCDKHTTLRVGGGQHGLKSENLTVSIKASDLLHWSITIEWQSVTASGRGHARRTIELGPGTYDAKIQRSANQRSTTQRSFDVVAIDSEDRRLNLGDPTGSAEGTKTVVIGASAPNLQAGPILFTVNTHFENQWKLIVSRQVRDSER